MVYAICFVIFKSDLIFSSCNILIVKLENNLDVFIVGLAYYSPLEKDKTVLNDIENCLNFIEKNCNNLPIFLGGDF